MPMKIKSKIRKEEFLVETSHYNKAPFYVADKGGRLSCVNMESQQLITLWLSYVSAAN
jgi:hypothetical protein